MQKIVKFTDDKYICPQKAIRKFRSAKKLCTPLYLYGVTGIGKTSLVMHNLNMKCCSYYSASETSADQIKIKEQSAEYTVVLDDLQNLTDTTERENYFEVIRKLLSLNNVWLMTHVSQESRLQTIGLLRFFLRSHQLNFRFF